MQPLFFSISGQRFTDRTNLYNKMQRTLPETFPAEHFAFLGNPFWNLAFPLLWNERERSRFATTRLLSCWEQLDDFCCKRVKPAFETATVVFTDGFGLDALLYSTALIDSAEQNEKAFLLHNSLVDARLKVERLSAPRYLIARGEARAIDEKMCQKSPKLRELNLADRHAFIQYEERTIAAYFDRIDHQKVPHYIDAGLSVDEMALWGVGLMGQEIEARNVREREAARA